MLNWVFVLLAVVLIISEWKFRARKYGKKEATKQMVVVVFVYFVVRTAFHMFFPL
jgi:hypothetical protein